MGCCFGKPSETTGDTELIALQADNADSTMGYSEQDKTSSLAFPQPQAPAAVAPIAPQTSPTTSPRPEFIPFTVPHLCMSEPYDGKDFWIYPKRCGWIVHAKDIQCHFSCPPGTCYYSLSPEELDEEDERVRPPMFSRSDGRPVLASDKVAFLQAWLFFGGLTEVSNLCGLETDIAAEFITNDGSISTAGFNGLPGRWFEAAVKTGRAGDKVVMERILTVARHSCLMLSEEFDTERTYSRFMLDPFYMFTYTSDQCRVLYSLEILVRTIGLHLLLHIHMPGSTAAEDEGWGQSRVQRSLTWSLRSEGTFQLFYLALEELKKQGWCESELRTVGSCGVEAFASLIPRPRTRDHSSCGTTICNAYQTDEATYQTRHVKDACSCAFVGVATSVLVDALSNGKIPKLVITEELEIQVVSEYGYPYIALSHVWADGLGNPLTNALPRCQLGRLRDYVYHLGRVHGPTSSSTLPIAFWMDTLCIPVDPSARVYRKKAIQLLGKTFQEASAVLVLDRELEIVESATATFLELGLRILVSGWAKRLWTLQEAALAGIGEAQGAERLYFQMQDGPFQYDRSSNRFVEERYLLLDQGIMTNLGRQIPSVQAMREPLRAFSPFFGIFNATQFRSTSKFEDIPVCIASLLGKDLSTILSADNAEQRMANFYVLMREVPSGMAWSPHTTKLSIRPFRWAPKSITGPGSVVGDYIRGRGEEDSICDAAGLHVKAGGFIFAESDIERYGLGIMLPRAFDITFADTGDVFGKLRCLPPGWGKKQFACQRDLALIFKHHDRRDEVSNTVVVIIEETVKSVSDDGTHSTEFVCRIVGYLHLWLPGEEIREDSDEDEDEGGEDDALEDAREPVVFKGNNTPEDQRWCLT